MSDRWANPSGDDPRQQGQTPPGAPPPPPPAYGQYGQGAQYGGQAGQYGQGAQYGQYGGQTGQYGQGAQYGHYGGPPPPGYGPGGPPPFDQRPAWMVAKPGVIPLRPLALGDIYTGAMATIRGNPAATIGLSMVLAVVVAVPTSLAMLGLRNVASTDETAQALSLMVRSLGQLVTSFTSIVLAGMLVAVLSEAVLGRRMSIGEAWRRARGHILSLIALPFLIAIAAVLAVVIVVLIIAVLAQTTPTAVSVTVGIVLGIAAVCGLILWYVRLMLAAPAIVLERCGPITGMKRSWRLSHGQFWRLFGINLLTSIILGVITSVVTAVVLIPAAIGTTGDPGTMLPLTTALSLLLGGVIAPFQANVTGLLYIDERIRKEGLDVSLAASATATQKNAGY